TVHCGAFSPDGHLLVSVSDDHTARLWDLATGSLLVGSAPAGRSDRRFLAPGDVPSPDGKWVLRVEEQTARFIDPATGSERGPRLNHGARIRFAAFSAD